MGFHPNSIDGKNLASFSRKMPKTKQDTLYEETVGRNGMYEETVKT